MGDDDHVPADRGNYEGQRLLLNLPQETDTCGRQDAMSGSPHAPPEASTGFTCKAKLSR